MSNIINEELKTPYFMIDKNNLDKELSKLKKTLDQSWPNYIVGYSYKTNALPWVINYFKENGCYAEVVSDDEYNLAKSIGVEKSNVVYNGIAKSKDTFLEAIRNRAIVNIDSEYEVEWLDELGEGEYEVGVRVNFDLNSMCPGQTQCGDDGERFGFCYENGELKRIIDEIEGKGVHVGGLHLHKSSKTRMPDIYKAMSEVAVEIAEKYSLELSYVDIGGGFFGGLESKPQFDEYFQMVSKILSKRFDSQKTVLIVEPGMAMIGASVDYVTKVVDIKNTINNTFIVTDGSRIHIDPLMTKSNYFYDIAKGDIGRANKERQIICGFTCMEHDRLFEIKDDEELKVGDIINYHKVGAYTMCLSPLFIKWYPDVYVNENGKMKNVRLRWTENEYKSRSF